MINQWLSGPYSGIVITPDLFPMLFYDGYHRAYSVTDGLPDNAVFSGIFQTKFETVLVFKSESWGISRFGEELPMLIPQFSTKEFPISTGCPLGHKGTYIVSEEVYYCPTCKTDYARD